MHTLQNGRGLTYIFSESETNDNVKVTIYDFPNNHFQGSGKWKSRDAARAQYSKLRHNGFQPVAMPQELRDMLNA